MAKLEFSLVSTIANTKFCGQIATPAILKANGYDIFNRKEQGRILARDRTRKYC